MPGHPASDTERLRRLNELLDQALSLSPQERDDWLRDVEPALAPTLRALLARATGGTDTFMGRPALAGDIDLAALAEAPDEPGRTIGPWRLVRELGRGGMATVWLATRADGALAREVALKLPQHAWSAALVQRMARERDLLAALEHPHIARLYDAGITDAGRPWLAMEYVDGEPIDRHCAAHSLPVAARLRLLLQVCEALSHAHSRLIVHRDLKPQNILVAQGRVRLLDFGVGKLLHDDGPAGADLTEQLGRAITPAYASPEQVANQPVTAASDVYSLGVVMFELLTGQRPYRLERQSTAALEEAILDADMPRASTRAADPRVARTLRGDLDAILAKALARRPERRYASVEALAGDLQRWLDGRPVLAQPVSVAYRARKFARRHRAALAAASLTVVALLAGLAGTLTQALRAERLAVKAGSERDKALDELAFAQASESFLQFLLTEGSGRAFTTAELLARAEQAVQAQFAGDPRLRTRLLLTVADLYGTTKNLRQMGVVLALAETAAAQSRSAVLQAHVACRRAGLLALTGELAASAAIFETTMAALQADAATDDKVLIACLGYRAQLLRAKSRDQEAAGDSLRALHLLGEPTAATLRTYGQLHAGLAVSRGQLEQTGLAVQGLEEAITRLERSGLERSAAGSTLVNNLAVALWRAGQQQRAAQVFERWLTPATPAELEREHVLATNLGRLHVDIGNYPRGLEWLQRAERAGAARGDAQNETFILMGQATAHCRQRDWSACDAALAELRRRMQRLRPPGDTLHATIDNMQAEAWWDRGEHQLAREATERALSRLLASPHNSAGLVNGHAMMAQLLAAAGDVAAAQQHAERSIDAARQVSAGFEHSKPMGRALIAQALVERARGDEPAAEQTFERALAQLRGSLGAKAALVREGESLRAAR